MNVKQAIIQYVPPWAILSPSNAKENMGLQSFNLGNCTIMIISNHGTVPISRPALWVSHLGSLII